MRMSKEINSQDRQRRRWFGCILAVSLSVSALLLVSSGAAQRTAQDPATPTTGARNAALISATQEVLKETSEVRQLSILRAVQSSTQSRAQIERAIMKNMDDEVSPADMHAAEVTLKKLGLAP